MRNYSCETFLWRVSLNLKVVFTAAGVIILPPFIYLLVVVLKVLNVWYISSKRLEMFTSFWLLLKPENSICTSYYIIYCFIEFISPNRYNNDITYWLIVFHSAVKSLWGFFLNKTGCFRCTFVTLHHLWCPVRYIKCGQCLHELLLTLPFTITLAHLSWV